MQNCSRPILMQRTRWQWSLRGLLVLTTVVCISLVVVNAVRAEWRRQLVWGLINEAVESALETSKDSPETAKVDLDMVSEQVTLAPTITSADRLRLQSSIAEALLVVEARRIELERRRKLIDTSCGQPIRDAGKITH